MSNDTADLQDRLDWARGRLESAERSGKPGHIARCRARYEGLFTKCTILAARGAS